MITSFTILRQNSSYTFLWQPYGVEPGQQAVPGYLCWGTTNLLAHQQIELQAAIDSAAQTAGQLHPAGADNRVDSKTPLLRLGRLLFRHLAPAPLQEILRRLEPETPVCICTNDTELPWELLHDDQEFLALRHCVTRQLLAHGDGGRSVATLQQHSLHCLLIGNPNGDLAAADAEVENLLELLETAPQPVQIELLCREQASKVRVIAALAGGEFDLIHFACHARPGALRLADGWLEADEIRTVLRGRPMVVLNGCNSGRTRPQEAELPFAGQQVHSLAQAFLLGGAALFLGAAWPVDDDETHWLALEFYRSLLAGHSTGSALRQARMRSRHKAPHTAAWAAPVLYGDPLQCLPQPALQRQPGTILTAHIAINEERTGETLESYARRAQETAGGLVTIARRHGGEVIALRPDYLRVLFGVPGPVEDDAARAMHAALAMRSAVGKQAGENATAIAITIASGEIAMATLFPQARAGEQDSSTPTSALLYFGPLFAEADALTRQSQPNQVVANERASKLAQDRFIFSSRLWEREHDTVLCYEVTTSVYEESALTGGLGGSLRAAGQFLGRERELDLLATYWQGARVGRGLVMGIAGEAGIGKTRLLQEFCRMLPNGDQMWIDLTCSSTERDTPYTLVNQLLRRIFGILADDDDDLAQVKIAQGLARLPSNPLAADPQINQILRETMGLSISTVPVEERKIRRSHLVHLLRTLMAYYAQQQPLIIAIDDVHWSDEASLELLGQVTDGIHRLPVQFLLLYRPEWQHHWFGKAYYRHLSLDQLDQVASFALLQTLLRSTELPKGLAVLLQKTGGNPFFIEEMVLSLQESGILIQRSGLSQPDAPAWELRRPLAEHTLPGTVERTLRVRLETLTPATREVLETAAIIGPSFGLPLLQKLLKTTGGQADPALAELEQRGFIEASWDVQDYRFRHALILDTVYQTMPITRHQAWHRRIAELLEEGPQPTEIEKLAHHWYHSLLLSRPMESPKLDASSSAQQVAKAAGYLIQCGQRALERYAASEAANYYRRALFLNSLLPATNHVEVISREGLGDALSMLGDFDAAGEELRLAYGALHTQPLTRAERRRAADLARRIGLLYAWRSEYEAAMDWMAEGRQQLGEPQDDDDKSAAALLHVHTGSVEYNRGNYAQVVAQCERGLQLAAASPTPLPAQAEAYNLLGIIAWANGRSQEALTHYTKSHAAWLALGNSYRAARVEGNMGVAYFHLAQWEQARLHHTRCKEYWEQIENQDMLAHPCLNLGNIYLYQGDWEQAELHFHRALALWGKAQHKRFMSLGHTNLGLLYIEQGEWEKALAHLEESRALLTQLNIRDLLCEVLYALAEVALGTHDLERALELATQSHDLAVERDMSPEQALALRIRGRIYLACDDSATARADLDQALAILQAVENRYEEARTRYYLAGLELQAGQTAKARAHLDSALTSFTALGAKQDCRRAESLAAGL